MYDDSVIKNNDNPASYSNTNKLLWFSDKKSNVTSLGKEKTGLFLFNETVKNSIKYLYLNNNGFSDVNALKDFPKLIELQCQCNPNLSNVDGLSGHTDLSILTLHNCSLSSIGNYNGESKEYSGGLIGCTNISRLTLQKNSSLNSLVGIENSKNLVYLVANNCGLTVGFLI